MSFDVFQFESPIYDRLNSAPISSAVQGVWNTVAPPTIKVERGGLPYIVFFITSGVFGNTFENNIVEATYQVSVFDHPGNGDVAAKAVMAQVFGDSEGKDNAPTYGLARWKVGATADAATAMMIPEDFITRHTPDGLHFAMSFRVSIQEA